MTTTTTPPSHHPTSWLQSKADMAIRISKGRPAPASPTSLPLKAIGIVEEVFQHRSANHGASRHHVAELVKSLRANGGKPLEPVTIFWVGDSWILTDGHHRVEAYDLVGYASPVPVVVFVGTLDQAIGQALNGNSKDKLQMTSHEKSNGAWRLVIATNLSISETVLASTRSRQTIVTMRNVKKALQAGDPGIDLGDLSWFNAMCLHKKLTVEPSEYDEEWLESEGQKLAISLYKHFGNRLGEQPQVLWRALEIYNGQLTENFLSNLGIDPSTLERWPDEGLDSF